MNNKLFFVADGHLNKFMYANNPLIKEDAYRAFNSVVDEIIKDTAEHKAAIFCGDMLDTKKPTSQDIQVLQKGVLKLNNSNIKVYGIDGNHDLCNPSWSTACGIHMFDSNILDILGYKIGGFSYVAGFKIEAKMLSWVDRECDFLIMHQPFYNLSPFEANTLDIEDIPSSVGIAVVSGHVHVNFIGKNSQDKYLVSPGAIHARKINHNKGTFVTYTDTEGFATVEVPYAREIYRDQINNTQDIIRIEKEISEFPEIFDEDLRPIVGLKYSLSLDIPLIARITKTIESVTNKYKAFFITTLIKKNTPESFEDTKMQEDISAEFLLSEVMSHYDWTNSQEIYDCLLPFIKDGDMNKIVNKCKEFKEVRDAIK